MRAATDRYVAMFSWCQFRRSKSTSKSSAASSNQCANYHRLAKFAVRFFGTAFSVDFGAPLDTAFLCGDRSSWFLSRHWNRLSATSVAGNIRCPCLSTILGTYPVGSRVDSSVAVTPNLCF